LGADPKNIENARKLRREMSLPEVLLWRELRGKPQGLKFRRQFPVLGYVADFACVEIRLLIEIDGIVHDMGDRPQRDPKRDAVLTSHGWHVARIAAKNVLADPMACAASIVAFAESSRPLHHQPAAGGPPPRSGEVLRKPA
jgi:very-short-patch-repair endonuclease